MQLEAPERGRSPVQGSPTVYVCVIECDQGQQ